MPLFLFVFFFLLNWKIKWIHKYHLLLDFFRRVVHTHVVTIASNHKKNTFFKPDSQKVLDTFYFIIYTPMYVCMCVCTLMGIYVLCGIYILIDNIIFIDINIACMYICMFVCIIYLWSVCLLMVGFYKLPKKIVTNKCNIHLLLFSFYLKNKLALYCIFVVVK